MESGKPRHVIKEILLAALAVVVILSAAGYRSAFKGSAAACHSITLTAETVFDGKVLVRFGAVTADVSPTRT